MLDDATMLLGDAGQEAGHILEGDERDVERVAEPHEAGTFERAVDMKHAGQDCRLVRYDSHRVSAQVREPDHDVLGVIRMNLVEAALIDHARDHLVHVVRLVRAVGHDGEQLLLHAIGRIIAGAARRSLHVVLGDVVEQVADLLEAGRLGVADEMRHPRGTGMNLRAAQTLEVDLLVRHRLHHLRPSHEHVGGPVDHIDEVGDRRRVDGATRTRSQNRADLGHDTRGLSVSPEDLRVPAQRRHPFLNPRAARVVEPDNRAPSLHRQVHHLADLLRVRFGQRTAEHGEVLRKHAHVAAVDPAVPGDDPIAQELLVGQPKLVGAMRHEAVELPEGSFVQQQIESFAGRELAFGVLRLDAFPAATQLSLRLQLGQPPEPVLHPH